MVVTDEHESDHPVDVIDKSGTLVAVDPGPPYTGPEIGDAAASSDPESDPVVRHLGLHRVQRSDVNHDRRDRSGIVVERPECQGDAIGGNPHQVTLTFDGPVDATAIDVQLVETPG